MFLMHWIPIIFIVVMITVLVLTRVRWRRKTYTDVLEPYLKNYGCELIRIDIPRFYETGPFPKVAIRMGAVQTRVFGVSTTHFEYRIVTFRDRSGIEITRWVRMLLHPLGAQDIVWEPGTTELPDGIGWPS